jgi:PAS domain S-box-containing protein
MADWGLAISHDRDQSAMGVSHSIGGTPAYMAPELAAGMHDAVCYQTDVYLLGAVLFQILTGYPPHRGKSLLACIHAAAHNEIQPTDVDGELMEIAMQAMATDPADRFASVDEFISRIRNQRKHEDSTRLVRRACDRLARATDANQYEDFRIADALLGEAIDVWPANRQAHQARKRLQMSFAESATLRGDLDLALSIYEAAGESDSDEAKRVRRLRSSRDESHRRVSRYSALFTQSPEAGLLLELSSGKVVEANEMFGRLFGYAEEDVVGKPIAELNLWADPERRDELVQELHRSGSIDNFEAEFLATDGTEIDVLISGRVVEVQGVKMIVSAIRDISLRKQAEHEVYKNRQRLRDLQRLAGLTTWAYDVATGEITWSEGAFTLAGRSASEGVPNETEFYAMIHPDDRPALKQTIQSSIQSGSAYELVIRQRGARGRYKRVIVRGQPIFDEDGTTTEVYGVLIPQKS